MNNLFSPLQVGRYKLKNRIIMAPMTRSRANPDGVPAEMAAQYYAQRATAGLIISEGTYPSPMGKGYLGIPGMHTQAQVAGWKKVTDAVHAKGGRIFLQIMHTGRIGDPSFLPDSATPVAPSAIKPNGQSYTMSGMKPHVTPRALEKSEIAAIINEYAEATRLALAAGFDGVELHAASGYLPMQFLSSGSNVRTDEYGGRAENRVRFVVETLQAMINVAGADRVGIKISPEMKFNDIHDDNPVETYSTLLQKIAPMGLAYLHVAKFGDFDYHALFRSLFKGPYFAGVGLTRETGETLIASGKADAAVYGNLFISNPDLPARFEKRAPLAQADSSTFYQGGERGYIDYPAMAG